MHATAKANNMNEMPNSYFTVTFQDKSQLIKSDIVEKIAIRHNLDSFDFVENGDEMTTVFFNNQNDRDKLIELLSEYKVVSRDTLGTD